MNPSPDPALSSQSSRAQTAASVEVMVRYRFDYLLALPAEYRAEGGAQWPLLVFLHGRGERGADLAVVKRNGPPKLIEEGRAFPAIVVSPQCPAEEWWSAPALEAFIAELQRRYRVDADRIYVTGLSMGGFATWELAVRQPEKYAAVVPICGAGEASLGGRLRDLPVWAFHGAKDPVVPVQHTQAMVDAIKAAGGAPRLTIYPEVEHDSWTQTYANEEVWTWLFAQRRSGG
ncbi:prolyl oligopeptidase family serine peptidase [Horticoccus luteus]|uniref:Prolyl oligopeptidase family serine peptidase n=1 Tax=Horticoccus luteus TaxID=2862869 RepID=A0A8F9XGA9_9BACT|nr:dienelactone hydrolase family protein [Horticoccus luteus]QYM78025.1 prolyl oligopeptidase family serine peptidase [Horticoccus luteus]